MLNHNLTTTPKAYANLTRVQRAAAIGIDTFDGRPIDPRKSLWYTVRGGINAAPAKPFFTDCVTVAEGTQTKRHQQPKQSSEPDMLAILLGE